MAGEASRKNGKKGGRPPGTKNPATLEREAVLATYRQKAMEVVPLLLQKQMHIASGQTFLYKIEKYYEKVGKEKRLRQKPPKLVTEQWEIEDYLNGKIVNGEPTDFEDTYYFITTKEPNQGAINDILDRTFGKSSQHIDIKGSLNIGKVLDQLDTDDES